ncbi:hypothetical protein [Marinobacter litoralis]|nr:hypothetical protein [Marinobacter litoralis]
MDDSVNVLPRTAKAPTIERSATPLVMPSSAQLPATEIKPP